MSREVLTLSRIMEILEDRGLTLYCEPSGKYWYEGPDELMDETMWKVLRLWRPKIVAELRRLGRVHGQT